MVMSVFLTGCLEEEQPIENTSVPAPLEQEEGQIEVSYDDAQEHMVRLEYYENMTPSSLDIKKGDMVSWWSQKRQGTFVLVSEEGLFTDQELKYRVPFTYTFYKSGTYHFTAEGLPAMNLTVNVS